MLINVLKKAVAYVKEIQDIGLFVTMSNSRWFASFSGSPLFYVMFPFIGILFTVSALINAYQFSTAHNKNFDKLFDLIISALCAVLASASLLGSVIAASTGAVFIAGPWLFLASASLALASQLFMAALTGYRAFESSKNSAQRMHYIQAALNYLFTSMLLTAVVGCVTFVMLTPVAPILGTACAFAATALSVSNIIWRIVPANMKTTIKSFLGLTKPTSAEELADHASQSQAIKHPQQVELLPELNYSRFFSHIDYTAIICECSFDDGREYLLELIEDKLELLTQVDKTAQVTQKIQSLGELKTSLINDVCIRKSSLLTKHPQAFQSFWMDKGDIEQIVDAVITLQQKNIPIHYGEYSPTPN